MNKIMELADAYAHCYAFVKDDSMPISRDALAAEIQAQQDYTKAVVAERDELHGKIALQAVQQGEMRDVLMAERDALRSELREPVVASKTWFEDGKVVTQNLTAKDIYKEPEQVSVELYLEQALEYVQMVERNVTTDPRYMSHQAEQRIQSALNIIRNEGFKSTFAEVEKHADLVARVKRAEVAQDALRKAAQMAFEALKLADSHVIAITTSRGKADYWSIRESQELLRKELGHDPE